jgi:phosphoribosylanthranilate isomerase
VELRVKICGITRLEDALHAAEVGADALGFNFWPESKRYIEPRAAAEIIRRLPPFVTPVGVFVNARRNDVLRAIDRSGVAVAQLHGDESPSLCRRISWPLIKAIRVEGPASLAALARYRVSAFLLDAPSPGYGGSGETFDWGALAAGWGDARVILAGGLNARNVAAAIRTVRPYGVDVASGVESAPGIKDPDQVGRFITAAKEA